jgi:hypothetical protein
MWSGVWYKGGRGLTPMPRPSTLFCRQSIYLRFVAFLRGGNAPPAGPQIFLQRNYQKEQKEY